MRVGHEKFQTGGDYKSRSCEGGVKRTLVYGFAKTNFNFAIMLKFVYFNKFFDTNFFFCVSLSALFWMFKNSIDTQKN